MACMRVDLGVLPACPSSRLSLPPPPPANPAPQDTAAELVEALQGTSLFLVGMMGSGKSTVGKLVAQALGYCFFDTGALFSYTHFS